VLAMVGAAEPFRSAAEEWSVSGTPDVATARYLAGTP